jgi:hypothetical protein
MTFSHPLARSASVFTARSNDGGEYRVLAIVTPLELDPKSHDYKKPFVEKLSKVLRIIWQVQARRPRLSS